MVDIQPHRHEKAGSPYQGFGRRRALLRTLWFFILSGVVWFALIGGIAALCHFF